jgi:hypothetical protein
LIATIKTKEAGSGVPDPASLLAQFALAVFPQGKCCAGLAVILHGGYVSLVQISCIQPSEIPIWLNSNLSSQI